MARPHPSFSVSVGSWVSLSIETNVIFSSRFPARDFFQLPSSFSISLLVSASLLRCSKIRSLPIISRSKRDLIKLYQFKFDRVEFVSMPESEKLFFWQNALHSVSFCLSADIFCSSAAIDLYKMWSILKDSSLPSFMYPITALSNFDKSCHLTYTAMVIRRCYIISILFLSQCSVRPFCVQHDG